MMKYVSAVELLAESTEQQLRQHRRSVVALLGQLTQKQVTLSHRMFVRSLHDTHNRFCFALQSHTVVGVAQVAIYQTLTGWNVWVENVVVDRACRGQGIGRELLRQLYGQVDLPSNESVAWVLANRPVRANAGFYEQFGFRSVPTTVFKAGHDSLASQLA